MIRFLKFAPTSPCSFKACGHAATTIELLQALIGGERTTLPVVRHALDVTDVGATLFGSGELLAQTGCKGLGLRVLHTGHEAGGGEQLDAKALGTTRRSVVETGPEILRLHGATKNSGHDLVHLGGLGQAVPRGDLVGRIELGDDLLVGLANQGITGRAVVRIENRFGHVRPERRIAKTDAVAQLMTGDGDHGIRGSVKHPCANERLGGITGMDQAVNTGTDRGGLVEELEIHTKHALPHIGHESLVVRTGDI